jgi:hypothetical protein
MPDPDIFDLLRESDPARSIGVPGPDSAAAQGIRQRVQTAAAAGPRRDTGRLVGALVVALLLVTGTAIAATISLTRSSTLESEGRGLEVGSERELRRIETGDATWTVVRYRTTDGFTCVDSELMAGDTFQGAIGGCRIETVDSPIDVSSGGVWDGERLQVLLTGSAAPEVDRVSATDNLGHVVDDRPVNGIWAIIPLPDASSWVVEAFNKSGSQIYRTQIEFDT